MNLAYTPYTGDVFTNVRTAYRLLHDYQCMVRDGVSYISGQFDIGYIGCYPLMKHTGLDRTKFKQSPWDLLMMISCEIRFQKDLGNGNWLVLSFLVISDTVLMEVEDKETLSRILPAGQTFTNFAFIMRKTQWTPLEERLQNTDSIRLVNFIKEGGALPDELTKAGYVGKCYAMSCLSSELEANRVVADIVAFCNEKSLPLELKKSFN